MSADAYDLIIDSLGRARQFDAAWRILVEMGQDGVGPTSKTFAVLIRRHVAAGLTRQAIRAFDDMEAFIGREPDKEEFCMLLDTLCKYKYPKVYIMFVQMMLDILCTNAAKYTSVVYS